MLATKLLHELYTIFFLDAEHQILARCEQVRKLLLASELSKHCNISPNRLGLLEFLAIALISISTFITLFEGHTFLLSKQHNIWWLCVYIFSVLSITYSYKSEYILRGISQKVTANNLNIDNIKNK